MTERSRSIDAGSLVAALDGAGLLAGGGAAAIAAELTARPHGDDVPLSLKILSAIGTFFATAFFLGFLGAAELVDFRSGPGLFAWGAGFLAVGMGLAASLRDREPSLRGDMLAQTSVTALAIGKVLVVVGAGVQFGVTTPWVATIALLAVTVLTYPVSGSSLDRVLSPYAVAASILWEILERHGGMTAASSALAVYFLVATGLAGGLLLPARISATWRPIGFAALAAMGTVVAVLASGHDFGLWMSRRPIDPRPIEALLTLALIGLIGWVAGGAAALATPRLLPVVLGVGALGFAAAPGIVYALGLLILGHVRHDRTLRVVGALALPAFLVLWYWARDMDFLAKSAALVGSGAALLLGRGWVAVQGLDRETDA